MKVLVTGAYGFVGKHLTDFLRSHGDEVVALDRSCDITDGDALRATLRQERPSAIYHLAARTHVGDSFRHLDDFMRVNVVGTQQLLGAASDAVPEATILLISSGDVYGATELSSLPHTEESLLHPLSPYAASKIEAERVGLEAARHGQTVIIARPFNHIGVGQADDFLVPGLIARFRDALQRGEDSIPVGDLSVSRDFTDVRDVVRAYRLLVEDGASGEIYNVASGKLVGVAAVAQLIQQRVAPTVAMREDPSFLRASDNPYSCGSAEKLRLTTGWEPRISLESSLDALTSH